VRPTRRSQKWARMGHGAALRRHGLSTRRAGHERAGSVPWIAWDPMAPASRLPAGVASPTHAGHPATHVGRAEGELGRRLRRGAAVDATGLRMASSSGSLTPLAAGCSAVSEDFGSAFGATRRHTRCGGLGERSGGGDLGRGRRSGSGVGVGGRGRGRDDGGWGGGGGCGGRRVLGARGCVRGSRRRRPRWERPRTTDTARTPARPRFFGWKGEA